MRKISKKEAKELINKGYLCTMFDKAGDDVNFYFIMENVDNRIMINFSDRCGDINFDSTIYDLFYEDEFQNDGYLDCEKSELETLYDVIKKRYPLDKVNFYLSNGRLEKVKSLKDYTYMFINPIK